MTTEALILARIRYRDLHRKADRDGCHALKVEADIGRVDTAREDALPSELRDKLRDFGREWERRILSQALHEGWTLFRMESGLRPKDLNPFESEIQKRMTTPAIRASLLFCEGIPGRPLTAEQWEANVYVVAKPGVDLAEFRLAEAPGVQFMRAPEKIA